MSVWFGPKVALSELSCSFGPGVTGLLGPNGAGKTTLMRAITGMIGVNQGTRPDRGPRPASGPAGPRPDGARPRGRGGADRAHRPPVRSLRRRPARRRRPRARRTRRCGPSALLDVADRRVDGFSKGMRQRTKVASALVTDPQVLVLDEPLNGADPVQRVHLIALFKQLGASGRTVIVSSHVLNEVERLAERVIVLDPRPPGRRRRPPCHPRRDGRPPAPRARAVRRRPAVGGGARRRSTRSAA